MTRGVSIWLDVLRALATILVVLSHWAYPRFTEFRYAFFRDWNVGSDAVIVFFVISGCVIAYAAERDGDPGRFVFNRLTRLWSVILPALILTMAFDTIGSHRDSSAYPSGFYQAHSIGDFLLRGMSFSNEWSQFGRIRLGTNGPLWSLSYEAAYYALFAAAFFLRGPARLAMLMLGAVVFGIDVLLLMPAWLLGVGFWHWLRADGAQWITGSTGLMLAVAGPLGYLICQFAGVPQFLSTETAAALRVQDARWVLGFSDEFIWNFLIGIFTVCHLVGVSVIYVGKRVRFRFLTWFAGASFSIYVVHYPTLHLLDAFLPVMSGRDTLLLAGSIAAGLAFASIFERPIRKIRSAIRSTWAKTATAGFNNQ